MAETQHGITGQVLDEDLGHPGSYPHSPMEIVGDIKPATHFQSDSSPASLQINRFTTTHSQREFGLFSPPFSIVKHTSFC